MLRIKDWSDHFENAGSRKLKKLEWVPVPIRMDGAGYTALVDHPNAAEHFAAWMAIVEIAAGQDVRGTLPRAVGRNPHDVPGICQTLGRISRLPARIFLEVIPRLLDDIKWLEELDEKGRVIDRSENHHATSATTLAESPNGMAKNGTTEKGIEGKGREEKRTAAAAVVPFPVQISEPPPPSLMIAEILQLFPDAEAQLLSEIEHRAREAWISTGVDAALLTEKVLVEGIRACTKSHQRSVKLYLTTLPSWARNMAPLYAREYASRRRSELETARSILGMPEMNQESKEWANRIING